MPMAVLILEIVRGGEDSLVCLTACFEQRVLCLTVSVAPLLMCL